MADNDDPKVADVQVETVEDSAIKQRRLQAMMVPLALDLARLGILGDASAAEATRSKTGI